MRRRVILLKHCQRPHIILLLHGDSQSSSGLLNIYVTQFSHVVNELLVLYYMNIVKQRESLYLYINFLMNAHFHIASVFAL